jgi:hypothetical protein
VQRVRCQETNVYAPIGNVIDVAIAAARRVDVVSRIIFNVNLPRAKTVFHSRNCALNFSYCIFRVDPENSDGVGRHATLNLMAGAAKRGYVRFGRRIRTLLVAVTVN